jgi:hypothetical protein
LIRQAEEVVARSWDTYQSVGVVISAMDHHLGHHHPLIRSSVSTTENPNINDAPSEKAANVPNSRKLP